MLEILLSLIVSFTGINRTVDPILVADAERRAHEIMVDFSHNGQIYPEILQIMPELPEGPAATIGLMVQHYVNSASHWAVMSNPSFTRIGCAVLVDAQNVYYTACSFGESVVQLEKPPVVVLPNTAMENPDGKERKVLGPDI